MFGDGCFRRKRTSAEGSPPRPGRRGEVAASQVLGGLQVTVADVLDAE
jgi:hypothetical protein